MAKMPRGMWRVLLIKPGTRVDVVTYGKTALYGPVMVGTLVGTFLWGRAARVRLDAVEGTAYATASAESRTLSYPSFRVTRA